MEILNTTAAPNITAELVAALVLLIVLVKCFRDEPWENPQSLPRFICWTLLVLLVLVTDMVSWYTLEKPELQELGKLADAVKHCSANCMYTMFSAFYFSWVREHRVPLWLIIVYQAVPLVAGIFIGCSVYFGMIFDYTDMGHFAPGPLYLWFNVVTQSMTLAVLFLVLWYHRTVGWHDTLAFMSYSIMPAVLGLQEFWHLTPTYLSFALVQLLIYLLVCKRRADLAALRKRELAEKDLLLMQSRINTMVSQIQPHFIFNALTTIRYLCGDAEEARQAIADFSDYLRVNINSLKTTELIPFRTELEHIRIYLRFEQLRFGDKLRVELDTDPEDFLLPCLSVQPIVENAVKYGLGKKPQGGTVRISTRAEETDWLVQVTDDGVGFDPAQVTGENHVGLNNVQNRLELMCAGSLRIESKLGSGTCVTLRIPKAREEKQEYAAFGSR